MNYTSTSKKRTIISLIFFLISLIITLFTTIKFKENYEIHYIAIFFISSIVFSLLSTFLIKYDFSFDENKHRNIIYTSIFLISILFSYIIVELLNSGNIFTIRPKLIFLNLMFIFILHLIMFVITNNLKWTIILSNIAIYLVAVINYFVTRFRGTPLVPWDILSAKTAATVASTYTIAIVPQLVLASFILIFLIILSFKLNNKPSNIKQRLILDFTCLVLITTFFISLYNTNMLEVFETSTNLWEPILEYKENGLLVSLLKQSKNLINKAPDEYSIEKVNSIIQNIDIDDNNLSITDERQKPNIIIIMNESFSNLRVINDFETTQEFLPFFYSLKENTIRGNVHVSVFGGSTPNSEWEALTGNSMAFMPARTIPYQQYLFRKTNSLVTTLSAQNYSTSAFHSYYASGYRRNVVYPLLGFSNIKFINELSNLNYLREYPDDLSTYKNIIDLYENKEDNEKIFNFTLTMQNHSGYDYNGDDFENTVLLKDSSNYPKVNQYLSLIKKSDEALEYLINYFKEQDEHTIILMFGDHQPYVEDEFYDYLMERF